MNDAPQSLSTAPQSIYLNSALNVNDNSGTNNDLTFSFNPPISVGDNAMPFIGIRQFTTFNGFANISALQNNNVVKVVNVMYNALTGVYDSTTYARTFILPDDHYTNVDLYNYLQEVVPIQVDVTSTPGVVWYTDIEDDTTQVAYLYLGLGFSGDDNYTTDTPILAFNTNTYDTGKTDISPPSSSVYTKLSQTGETYSISTDPLVYAGLYLVYDADTQGFLSALGFDDSNVVFLPNTNGLRGLGWQYSTTSVPDETLETSPDTVSLAGPSVLYVCLGSTGTRSRAGNAAMNARNILAQIPINKQYGDMIVYEPPTIPFNYSPGLDLASISVTFCDQYMIPVDFRGVDWQMQLVVAGRYSLATLGDMLAAQKSPLF